MTEAQGWLIIIWLVICGIGLGCLIEEVKGVAREIRHLRDYLR